MGCDRGVSGGIAYGSGARTCCPRRSRAAVYQAATPRFVGGDATLQLSQARRSHFVVFNRHGRPRFRVVRSADARCGFHGRLGAHGWQGRQISNCLFRSVCGAHGAGLSATRRPFARRSVIHLRTWLGYWRQTHALGRFSDHRTAEQTSGHSTRALRAAHLPSYICRRISAQWGTRILIEGIDGTLRFSDDQPLRGIGGSGYAGDRLKK